MTTRMPFLRWAGVAALAICGLVRAADQPPAPSAFVHVLGFVSSDRFVAQTGVAVADGVVVTAWPMLANTGDKGVLDGGTDLQRHWRAADQMREFPQEGVLALSVPGLQAPHVQLRLPDLDGGTEVALVAFDTQGQGMASSVPELGMGVLRISRHADGSATVVADIAGSFSQPAPAGPLMDACGRLAGLIVDDVQGQRRVVASHTLMRLFNEAQIPYQLSTQPCLQPMPGGQHIAPWLVWLVWAAGVLIALLLLALAWRLMRRRRPAARAPRADAQRPQELALIMDVDGERSMLQLSWSNLEVLEQGARIGSAAPCEILIEHPSVAPLHARLVVRRGALCLIDLAGNVLVNQRRPMPDTPERLGDGDQIRLGSVSLSVKLGASSAVKA